MFNDQMEMCHIVFKTKVWKDTRKKSLLGGDDEITLE